jgi:hypothetical protein
VCTTVRALWDYDQPHAPGALVKAALVAAGAVPLRTAALAQADDLPSVLTAAIGEPGLGLELATWSRLPVGSGTLRPSDEGETGWALRRRIRAGYQ